MKRQHSERYAIFFVVFYCVELSYYAGPCCCNVQSILEALEFKLKNGWKPNRTLYIAFGHDEEVNVN